MARRVTLVLIPTTAEWFVANHQRVQLATHSKVCVEYLVALHFGSVFISRTSDNTEVLPRVGLWYLASVSCSDEIVCFWPG